MKPSNLPPGVTDKMIEDAQGCGQCAQDEQDGVSHDECPHNWGPEAMNREVESMRSAIMCAGEDVYKESKNYETIRAQAMALNICQAKKCLERVGLVAAEIIEQCIAIRSRRG